MKDIPLDAFERWMVKQNLDYVKTEGIERVTCRLRANGYPDIAAATLQAYEESLKVLK